MIDANERSPGAVFRYTELDGNIGLVVGGGGASLLQHDLMLAMGGAPANHLDATPGAGWQDKMGAVLDAILANPCVKGLLVSYKIVGSQVGSTPGTAVGSGVPIITLALTRSVCRSWCACSAPAKTRRDASLPPCRACTSCRPTVRSTRRSSASWS